jgi:hypothetical protein
MRVIVLSLCFLACLSKAKETKLAVNLQDGARVIGLPGEPALKFRTAFGAELDLPWEWIRTLVVRPGQNAELRLRNGDRLTGVLLAPLQLKSDFRDLRIPQETITRVSTWGDNLTAALRLHYAFDEDNATVRDLSGHEIHGTAVRTTWLAERKGCLAFDGNGYVVLPAKVALDDDAPKTICLWFRIDRIKPWARLLMWGLGEKRIVASMGISGLELGGTMNGNRDRATTTLKVQAGEWHHAAWTSDGATMRIYLDAIQLGQVPVDGHWQINDEGVYLGARKGGGATFQLQGAIDDLMIFNRELNVAEIRSICDTQTD